MDSMSSMNNMTPQPAPHKKRGVGLVVLIILIIIIAIVAFAKRPAPITTPADNNTSSAAPAGTTSQDQSTYSNIDSLDQNLNSAQFEGAATAL